MKKSLNTIWALLLIFFLTACSNLFFQEEDQISSGELPDLTQGDFNQEQVFIRYRQESDLAILKQTRAIQIDKVWPQTNWALVKIPSEKTIKEFLGALMAKEEIIYAEPDLFLELIPPQDNYQYDLQTSSAINYRLWGLEAINAEQAWEVTTGHSDVVVAIIDTGLQINHPEFANNEIINPLNATSDPYGDDYVEDFNGHGTHVTGIAVNDGQSGEIAGVAWDVGIMPIRVLNYQTGGIMTNYLVEALTSLGDYAENNPEKRVVANMSLGGRGYSVALKEAIDYANQRGVLVVAAAGNQYKRVIGFPASYNSVLSVAASDPYHRKAIFSSEGFYNSIAAPGDTIYSTYIVSDYDYLSGTSMAAPFVTGAVALLLSTEWGKDLTVLELMNQVEQTAQKGAYGEGFSEELGYGILDADALLQDIQPLQYGGLIVESNVEYGILALYNQEGYLVSFGATGVTENNYIFPALKPDNYTVTLSYNNQVYYSESIEVKIGATSLINLPITTK